MAYDYHIAWITTKLTALGSVGKVLRSGKVKKDPQSLSVLLKPHLKNSMR